MKTIFIAIGIAFAVAFFNGTREKSVLFVWAAMCLTQTVIISNLKSRKKPIVLEILTLLALIFGGTALLFSDLHPRVMSGDSHGEPIWWHDMIAILSMLFTFTSVVSLLFFSFFGMYGKDDLFTEESSSLP